MDSCGKCAYAVRIYHEGKKTPYVRCFNEKHLERISKLRNGTVMKSTCMKACKEFIKEDDMNDRIRFANELREDLDKIKDKMPINSYRSILGQIRKGDLNAACVGITNMERKIARDERRQLNVKAEG